MPSESVSAAPEQPEHMSVSAEGRPMKVWSACRQKRHGLVVTSLQDLLSKACQRLGVCASESMRCVLEEDGTEVDDNEYFATLPPHTVLLVLSGGQQWTPTSGSGSPQYSVSVVSSDETDASCYVSGADSSSLLRRRQLLQRLHSEPGAIALLSAPDLELLSQLPLPVASGAVSHQPEVHHQESDEVEVREEQEWMLRTFDAGFLQDVLEASCRYLDGRRDVEEALSFLKHCRKDGLAIPPRSNQHASED